MTTDRTSAARPPRHDRPAPRAQAQSPAADAFAELLGAQAPAQQRPERREPQSGRREGNDARSGFEASVDGRQGAASTPPPAAGQPGQPATGGAQAQPGATSGQGAPGQVATGAGAVSAAAEGAPAAGAKAPQAPEGVMGELGLGGEETTSTEANVAQQIKLPKVSAMPVPAPPEGRAATPAGWLGPKTPELKPTPAVAPAPPAAPVAAPPNGEAATPSGWRGPDTAAPAPQTAAPATAPLQAAPATPTSTPAPQPAGTTPLAHAPAVVNTLLQVAHERGITRARINLRPVELGGIEVRLHATAAGITAHLVADSPEAAKLLSQAGDELRRNLEQRDVNLLSLEVSTSADHHRDAPKGQHGPEADDFSSSVSPRGERAEESAADTTTTTSTLELPGGLLVDVLA
jgi:flagellar hook-length control protein FliK